MGEAYLCQRPEGKEGVLKVIISELFGLDKNIDGINPIRT